MTVYIAGPDGKPLAFATHAEADAYRCAQLEAEPPLLECLCKHQSTVCHLVDQAQRALVQRHGRVDAFRMIEIHLRRLQYDLSADILAAREAANPNDQGSQVSGEGEPAP